MEYYSSQLKFLKSHTPSNILSYSCKMLGKIIIFHIMPQVSHDPYNVSRDLQYDEQHKFFPLTVCKYHYL